MLWVSSLGEKMRLYKERTWLNDYNLPEEIYYNSFILAKKCSQEPKLVALQLKIVYNIINCNVNLFKWNISNTDTCEFCESGEKDNYTLFEQICGYDSVFNRSV